MPVRCAGYSFFTAMTVLEFIRKNSLLALIVIAALLIGFIMMDYSGKQNPLSKDFYIQVDGTGYSYPETYTMGENGSAYVQSLYSSTTRKMIERFDTDKNGELNEAENATMSAWLSQNPQVDTALRTMDAIYRSWGYGLTGEAEINFAINRAVLKAEAKKLGFIPSKEQIDAYIQSMPAFVNADGSFDQELYHRMTGFHNGVASNPTEKAFRDVISDMMVWECVNALITDNLQYNTKAQGDLIDAIHQQVSGKTAWLAKEVVPAPAEPTEEELKAYWETNKERYKSDERRIISLYTLRPAEDSNLDALMSTADIIMQDLSQANGKGLDQMLEGAAANPENAPFTYLLADGKTHITLPICTLATMPAELQTMVDHNGESIELGKVLFNEVDSAPSVAEYEAAVAAGDPEKHTSIRQIRGFFPTKENTLILARVEATEVPTVLPYEQAREKALADLKAERNDTALADAAKKLYDEMSATLEGGDINAVFEKAQAAGAVVSVFGPVSLGNLGSELPRGASPQSLMSTPSGKLTELAVLPEGAAITAVISRSIVASPEYTATKAFMYMPEFNNKLRGDIMTDWQNSAYIRFNVLLSDKIKSTPQQ